MGDRLRTIVRAINAPVLAVSVVLIVLLAVAEIGIVILRYVFGLGFIELQDFGLYVFGTLLILAIPWTLRAGRHVRVDIFRRAYGARWRRQIDRFAVLFLLIPVFGVTIWYVWPDIRFAWVIREGSVETGGLPGLFVVKTMLPIACILMILQGIAILVAPDDDAGGE